MNNYKLSIIHYPLSIINYKSLIVLIIFISACTSAPIRDARTAFYADQLQDAESILADSKQDVSDRDLLLFYMDRGLILHDLGKYSESNDELLKASKLIKNQDFISVSEQGASIIANDWVTEYKGEYSERLWVHTYLMMNFLLLYQYESALVEAKQALKLLDGYENALSRDIFTRVLIAMCFENMRQYNGVYIEYKKLSQVLENPAYLTPVLYRLAKIIGLNEDAKKYEALMTRGERSEAQEILPPELILFASSGKGPVKVDGNIIVPPSIRFSFPRYSTQSSGNTDIRIQMGAENLPYVILTTDVNSVARASLQERAARIIAKELTRAAAKEAVSRAVARKNDVFIEFMVRAALFMMETPDTRSWETLPASFNLVKIPLPRGTGIVRVYINSEGRQKIENISLPKSGLKPGQRFYYSIRVK
ncbi:tetratricopeptide-like domain-containing protein [Desulfonema limicola]|uniref:Tetratricopeptide-like domain-containing protein n=1 Tax=Desulfonema limicola TaxID=45656 RepID=A0A975B3C6_9BACT|nr:hypothetical protein [Desulfonema limicola]QTA78035.1 tetratricopeptide-like domain-containing protein [Desulfonema limicola]